MSPDGLLVTYNLREEVITAVDNEIRNCASDYEIHEEAYYQLQVEQWGRFYSCCVQYREVGAKLQGMFADSVTGLVCLIRKASISYLRPCDQLERLYLCPQEKLTPTLLDEMNFGVDVCEDVHKICQMTRLIQCEMSEEFAAHFILELQMHESPVAVAEKIVEAIFLDKDGNMRRLAGLELCDSKGLSAPRSASVNMSLVESFIQGVGGSRARQLVALTTDPDSQALWSRDLLSFVHSLASLIEPQKARRCFVSATEGIATETFLADKLLQGHGGSHSQLTIVYYLKVIKQFEEYGMADMVISLANEAVCLAEPDDPNLATLHSKVFKYQLQLGHNQEAYTAMMANPDPSRRKDCLRQLVVGLCERGELQDLVEFPYNNMLEEIELVLDSRARSVDLTTHNYYNLLYAFHIYRNNLRKGKTKVEIIELGQLEKDYLLLDARLRLIRKSPDPSLMSGPTPSADEMVGILVNAGFYDLAILVCRAFSLSLHTVFTSLALRCVNLARTSSYSVVGDDHRDTSDVWDWLRENDVQSSAASKDGR
nr:hypothetical protein BaRGS_030351 [Batillaria attramentaria]